MLFNCQCNEYLTFTSVTVPYTYCVLSGAMPALTRIRGIALLAIVKDSTTPMLHVDYSCCGAFLGCECCRACGG
jgi:hypothetical protein